MHAMCHGNDRCESCMDPTMIPCQPFDYDDNKHWDTFLPVNLFVL